MNRQTLAVDKTSERIRVAFTTQPRKDVWASVISVPDTNGYKNRTNVYTHPTGLGANNMTTRANVDFSTLVEELKSTNVQSWSHDVRVLWEQTFGKAPPRVEPKTKKRKQEEESEGDAPKRKQGRVKSGSKRKAKTEHDERPSAKKTRAQSLSHDAAEPIKVEDHDAMMARFLDLTEKLTDEEVGQVATIIQAQYNYNEEPPTDLLRQVREDGLAYMDIGSDEDASDIFKKNPSYMAWVKEVQVAPPPAKVPNPLDTLDDLLQRIYDLEVRMPSFMPANMARYNNSLKED
ncbi:hypothetical protein P153DRAFT_360397 [Dothidotthia symphoricarpi CBS 119687]|uniref:Uncharacterized protein n=1 Tax=Dothidotthia symphoricarpi CBS 119687 TaxID=1392245 RepID=A0A6A6A3D3_9PLEO|nr:uncharacterized protein P153DRAFT_360397 [Dothidotthia symphoricarpi CBS 119687]KAF2125417.1 hypothetical protein P153DRAFT_360397 [Dothidotthia symphoricarpi CBS 119687]